MFVWKVASLFLSVDRVPSAPPDVAALAGKERAAMRRTRSASNAMQAACEHSFARTFPRAPSRYEQIASPWPGTCSLFRDQRETLERFVMKALVFHMPKRVRVD